MSALDFVKKHPVGVGIGVIAVIGVVLLVSGGGGTEVTTSDGSSSDPNINAGLQLQALSIQANSAAQQTAAEKEVALASLATQQQIAVLGYQSADTQAQIAASVATQQITAGKEISSLQLANEAQQIQAGRDIQIATLTSLTEQVKINNQTLLAVTKEQNKPKGLFSLLFG